MKVNCSTVPFYLDVTLCCGQTFRWDKIGDWWYGVAGDKVLKVRQVGDDFEYAGADEKFVTHFFSLDVDLEKVLGSVNKDAHIANAIKDYWGLRMIRQDPWECLISYICATYKNIPAIRHMLNNMGRKFGDKVVLDGKEFFTFPSCERLCKASEADLAACGLGYRAKYVFATAKSIREGTTNFDALLKMSYEQAKAVLMEFPGVGAKVADCVSLFSLGKTEAFPVDVWVKRVLLNHYGDQLEPELFKKLQNKPGLSDSDYKQLNLFGRNYFGKYAGWAQEYLYHSERMTI
jgi:N-glycosylase/DNA lyase